MPQGEGKIGIRQSSEFHSPFVTAQPTYKQLGRIGVRRTLWNKHSLGDRCCWADRADSNRCTRFLLTDRIRCHHDSNRTFSGRNAIQDLSEAGSRHDLLLLHLLNVVDYFFWVLAPFREKSAKGLAKRSHGYFGPSPPGMKSILPGFWRFSL